MKQNLVTMTAKLLHEQMLNLTEASGKDFEQEAARMASMAQGAEQIAKLAEQEVKLIIGTNIIPQDSMLVAGIKDINEKPEKRLTSGDFTRSVVKD